VEEKQTRGIRKKKSGVISFIKLQEIAVSEEFGCKIMAMRAAVEGQQRSRAGTSQHTMFRLLEASNCVHPDMPNPRYVQVKRYPKVFSSHSCIISWPASRIPELTWRQ